MASLDSLPGDQRAVLQLVLGRGRSYDEIARLLSINPIAVRERALAALDALGPQTKVDAEHRGRIADYLLGQLAEGDVAEVRNRLAESPPERAWARVLSSELAPLASGPLPEIPASGDTREAAPDPIPDQAPPLPSSDPVTEPAAAEAVSAPAAETATPERPRRRPRADEDEAAAAGAGATQSPRSSRLGGALLIGVAILVVAGV
ncbi:MAG: sigma factor-like helix-turn-helix DNA-binding protein, partial [Solirubrobacteraceae bacterium]